MPHYLFKAIKRYETLFLHIEISPLEKDRLIMSRDPEDLAQCGGLMGIFIILCRHLVLICRTVPLLHLILLTLFHVSDEDSHICNWQQLLVRPLTSAARCMQPSAAQATWPAILHWVSNCSAVIKPRHLAVIMLFVARLYYSIDCIILRVQLRGTCKICMEESIIFTGI